MGKQIEINCPRCHKTALKEAREVTRQRKNNKPIYCSKECANFGRWEKRRTNFSVKRNCIYCGLEFESSTKLKHKKCCSLQCAGKISRLCLSKDKHQKGINAYYDSEEYKKLANEKLQDKIKKITKNCVICQKEFCNLKNPKTKTCSSVCNSLRTSLASQKHPNCGGETNYKRYYYKNTYMDSSWEVDLAKWMDENNILWKRDRLMCFVWKDSANKIRRYHPDFYLEQYNVYLDPKNKYLQIKDKEKLEQVQLQNKITIFSGFVDDIKKEIIKINSSIA